MNNDIAGFSNSEQIDQNALPVMSLKDAKTERGFIYAILAGGWGIFMTINFWGYYPIFFFTFGTFGLYITAKLVPYCKEVIWIASELDRDGMSSSAVIISRRIEPEGEGGCYYIIYQFNYMDNMFVGKQRVAYPPFDKLQIGDYISIRFLPNNPRISFATNSE